MTRETIVSGVAERLTRAIATNDSEAMAELYAPDASIWHSTDQIELTVTDLQGLLRSIASVATAGVRVTGLYITPDGFVQTQENTYTLRSGVTTTFHAALVATLRDDAQITRVEEYLDSAGLTPLLAALGAG